MKITDIATELQKIELPFLKVNESHGLTDCVHIHASLQPRSLWVNGYIENSPRLLAFIFCHGNYQRETDDSTYSFQITINGTGKKMRQKNNMTGEEACIYVKKQLEKLKGGEI